MFLQCSSSCFVSDTGCWDNGSGSPPWPSILFNSGKNGLRFFKSPEPSRPQCDITLILQLRKWRLTMPPNIWQHKDPSWHTVASAGQCIKNSSHQLPKTFNSRVRGNTNTHSWAFHLGSDSGDTITLKLHTIRWKPEPGQ